MKKFIIIIIGSLFLGCGEEFLERSSLTSIAENNFWQSEADARLGLNAIYSQLQGDGLYGGNLNGVIGFPHFDVISDNAYNQWEWEGGAQFMEGTLDPTAGLFGGRWNGIYSGISKANIAIDEISEMDESLIDAETKNNYIGQAMFLRALFYFNLALYYEEVPLITSYQTLEEAYVPKNSYQEINDQIIEDLLFAIDHLPEQHDSGLYGYATKGAALALLSRVQLYNKVYEGPNGVLELTQELLGLGYSLHPNYGQLFSIEGEYSPEIVFSVRFLRGADSDNGETFSATYLGTPKVDSRPMPNLVNDFYCTDGLPIDESPRYDPNNPGLNRDPRANATIYFPGDLFLVNPDKVYNGNGATGFGHRKYIRQGPDEEGNPPGGQGSQDFYLIRYAEVLLTRAEALVETGNLTGARELINQIRERVSMPTVEDVEGTSLTQDEMRDVVRHERRVELALEGLRFMDLKRWGEIEEGINRASADPVGPYDPVYLGVRSETFPIPQSELDVNENLIQNPAWE